MSPDVAAFLLDLLSRQTLGAADDDLERVAALCARSRRELVAALDPHPDRDEHHSDGA